ncbi:uncharacterized protein K452DRAFT_289026 [Aplosporella prunicola CBS 121167]|uniref:Uncharacterized protein n=1 Tax=Aplosporella prunicola CBS 121167 TaxID=1176127 RepID=A0A6A6B7U1_9PEZI|nr:uncharacterized protein K452DRAFT_289026 [Aplosporella prunicola CBS 121167]KAF2140262.1 hypothetical protein K452DRAFT_289026 [Aplosporella prunicola CBS 121167]
MYPVASRLPRLLVGLSSFRLLRSAAPVQPHRSPTQQRPSHLTRLALSLLLLPCIILRAVGARSGRARRRRRPPWSGRPFAFRATAPGAFVSERARGRARLLPCTPAAAAAAAAAITSLASDRCCALAATVALAATTAADTADADASEGRLASRQRVPGAMMSLAQHETGAGPETCSSSSSSSEFAWPRSERVQYTYVCLSMCVCRPFPRYYEI